MNVCATDDRRHEVWAVSVDDVCVCDDSTGGVHCDLSAMDVVQVNQPPWCRGKGCVCVCWGFVGVEVVCDRFVRKASLLGKSDVCTELWIVCEGIWDSCVVGFEIA